MKIGSKHQFCRWPFKLLFVTAMALGPYALNHSASWAPMIGWAIGWIAVSWVSGWMIAQAPESLDDNPIQQLDKFRTELKAHTAEIERVQQEIIGVVRGEQPPKPTVVH